MQLHDYHVGDEALAQVPIPDVYFGEAYGAAEEVATPGSAWSLLESFDGRWQLPLLITARDGIVDAASPYGYAGVYVAPSLSDRDRNLAWTETRRMLLERDVVSMFVRCSPLVPQADAPRGSTWIVRDHATRAIPVSGEDTMWSALEGRCRTSIRKARRLELSVHVRPATAEDLGPGSAFRRLYESAMERRGASDRYHFPDAYYEQLLNGLGSDLLFGSVGPDDEPLAAALFLRHGEFLHYHLSGGTIEAGETGATNLLLWEACRFAASHDVKVLHLGGGVEDRDSLYRFKRSFGGRELSFSAYGHVVDRVAYGAALTRRATQLDVSRATLAASRHFPAYRAGDTT